MNYDQIELFRRTSPSLKLLRAKNLSLIIGFLYQEFKEYNKITIPNFELLDKLADYVEFYDKEGNTLEEPVVRAKRYLDEWCLDENNYLRKYTDENGIDVHELTPFTEKVIQWLQDLNKREFIGTESRFIDIFHKLRELVEKSTENPEQRIAGLEKRKEEIDMEINQIRDKGVISFDTTQIKERFYEVNKLSRELLADFHEVNQNFKEIVRNIYEKQSNIESKKGDILGYALDATDELEESDQGKSFSAFWRFLMDGDRQDELERLLDEAYALLDQREIHYTDTFLKKLKFYLHHAGQKVIDSKRLLVSKLSRVLAGKSSMEKRHTIELIAEIKNLAYKAIERPPKASPFFEIDGDPDIRLDMEKRLGEKPQEATLKNHPNGIGGLNFEQADFIALYNQFEINREELEKHIIHLLERQSQVTLLDVLHIYPLENGLAELLTYFSIASQAYKRIINDEKYESILLSNHSDRIIKVPQIIFIKN